MVYKPSDPSVKNVSSCDQATYAPCPWLHHHWQIFIHTRLLLVVQTCDNLLELGPDCIGFWESADFSHLIASALAATECEHVLLWNSRTPLDSKPPHLLWIASFTFWPQKQITAWCSAVVQFVSGAASFKKICKQTKHQLNLTLTLHSNA